MAIQFPSSPTIGQLYEVTSSGASYAWTGTTWTPQSFFLGNYLLAGTCSISATTTAPVKGTVTTDQVYYRNAGSKTYEVDYNYQQTTGGTSGNGDYLFTLPAGLQFNTTVQPLYTGVLDVTMWQRTLSTMGTMGTNTASLPSAWVVPYSATRFRVIYWENISTIRMFNSNTATSMGFSQAGTHFRWKFQFTAQ